MSSTTNKVVGVALLGVAAWAGYSFLKSRGTISGFRGGYAQERERDLARARLYLAEVTGRGHVEKVEQEAVRSASGMAAGQARDFAAVMHREAVKGGYEHQRFTATGIGTPE